MVVIHTHAKDQGQKSVRKRTETVGKNRVPLMFAD